MRLFFGRRKHDQGVLYIEYVIFLVVLVVVFVAVGAYLRTRAENRADNSMDTGQQTVPCNTGDLTAEACL